jgi:hypothetical protein
MVLEGRLFTRAHTNALTCPSTHGTHEKLCLLSARVLVNMWTLPCVDIQSFVVHLQCDASAPAIAMDGFALGVAGAVPRQPERLQRQRLRAVLILSAFP